ncbi:MAG: hypothetical protein LBG94_07675 [Treponema sp.]|nr:hypothetical protein [Treponema sp.]
MTEKRLYLGRLVIVLVFGLMVVGCDDEPKKTYNTKTYYYEAYSITMSQYDTFVGSVPAGNNYSFSEIQGFRNILRGFGGTFVESNSGVTESELQSFANQHGLGGVEYNQVKEALDSVGNLITFFYTTSPSTMIWVYVEKE